MTDHSYIIHPDTLEEIPACQAGFDFLLCRCREFRLPETIGEGWDYTLPRRYQA